MAAFTAAGTSYATHGVPMVPIYVFYSMFGFQRTADSIWAAADQMSRGFLIGATAGRTTLTGEGPQHADGHSPLLAATNPASSPTTRRTPTRSRHIMQDGLRRMYGDDPRPAQCHLLHDGLQRADEPAGRAGRRRRRGHPEGNPPARTRQPRGLPEARRGCSCSRRVSACRGCWRRRSCSATTGASSPTSGRSLPGTSCGATALPPTSTAFLHPETGACGPRSSPALQDVRGPVVAVSDYMRQVQDQIQQWVPGRLRLARRGRLRLLRHPRWRRRFFHIDGPSVAVRALQSLADAWRDRCRRAGRGRRRYRLLDVTAGTSGSGRGRRLKDGPPWTVYRARTVGIRVVVTVTAPPASWAGPSSPTSPRWAGTCWPSTGTGPDGLRVGSRRSWLPT